MLRTRALPALLALLLVAPRVAAGEDAVAVVEKLNAGLEGVLRRAPQLDYKGRYAELAPILGEAFDFPFMARQAIGREWDGLAAGEQESWVAAFRELTTATYASRFDRYSGQSFETVGGAEPAAHETVTVASRVLDPGAEPVPLTYRLRQDGGAWKVIDVYLKGSVSEVALRRSEYASVLKRDGFAALLAAVNRRIDALAAGRVEPTPG